MKIGLHLPQLAHHADPESTRRVAREAEAAGFSSLWMIDRLLVPTDPRSRYPATEDGLLPPVQRGAALDPIVGLTLAAADTTHIRVGTGVLVAPWYPPALLARSLATLDRASGGRVDVGLGIGWSLDEYEAVGAPMANRGSRLEEVIDVMSTLWADGAASITTSRESIASSAMGAKPAQSPRPPILLGTYTTPGLERAGRIADGWLPGGVPLDALGPMWSIVLDSAERHDRDAEALRLVVRADTTLTEVAVAETGRGPFVGNRRQIMDDIARVAEIGAHELVLDLQTATQTTAAMMELALELAAGSRALTPVAAAV